MSQRFVGLWLLLSLVVPLFLTPSASLAESEPVTADALYRRLSQYNENEMRIIGSIANDIQEICTKVSSDAFSDCIKTELSRWNNPERIVRRAEELRVPHVSYQWLPTENGNWSLRTYKLPDGRVVTPGLIRLPGDGGMTTQHCYDPSECQNCLLCANVGNVVEGIGWILHGIQEDNSKEVLWGVFKVGKGLFC